jgi:hypothetical protein
VRDGAPCGGNLGEAGFKVSMFQSFKVARIDTAVIDTEPVSNGCPISRALFAREVGIFLSLELIPNVERLFLSLKL